MTHHSDPERAIVRLLDALTKLVQDSQGDAHIHRRFNILNQKIDLLMATLQQFVAAQTAFNTSIGGAIDGLVGDIANLNAQIEALRQQLGNLTPEQEAQLDTLIAAGEQLSTRITNLDALTPPSAP